MHNTSRRAGSDRRIRWVFTYPASPLEFDEVLDTPFRHDEAKALLDRITPHVQRAAFQLEAAPTTGYLHFQGMMELTNKRAMTWIKANILSNATHLEVMKGTPKQAWMYCTKLETRMLGPWTVGPEPMDVEVYLELCLNGDVLVVTVPHLYYIDQDRYAVGNDLDDFWF